MMIPTGTERPITQSLWHTLIQQTGCRDSLWKLRTRRMSAGTIEALKRPGAAEPAKAGDAVVAPKQEGVQGFYKVWVSDSPIEAE